jgi:hypothetical protein
MARSPRPWPGRLAHQPGVAHSGAAAGYRRAVQQLLGHDVVSEFVGCKHVIDRDEFSCQHAARFRYPLPPPISLLLQPVLAGGERCGSHGGVLSGSKYSCLYIQKSRRKKSRNINERGGRKSLWFSIQGATWSGWARFLTRRCPPPHAIRIRVLHAGRMLPRLASRCEKLAWRKLPNLRSDQKVDRRRLTARQTICCQITAAAAKALRPAPVTPP